MPWLLAAMGTCVGLFVSNLWVLNAPWKDSLLDKVIAACTIFVAYLLTAATIIPAIEEKAIVQKLKRWGYFIYIVDYLRQAIWASGVLLLLSLLAVPLPTSWIEIQIIDQIFSGAWWGVFAFTIGAVFRAANILIKLLLAR